MPMCRWLGIVGCDILALRTRTTNNHNHLAQFSWYHGAIEATVISNKVDVGIVTFVIDRLGDQVVRDH